MAVSIAALAIGAGIAIYGAVKKSQAAKKAAANVRPTYNIPQEEQDMLRLAESHAGEGMSSRSRQYYQNEADQGLSTTTDAILRGGGDPNSIGNAYSQYEKGINSLSVYDDQARMQHLNQLNSAYARMSGNRDKEWQVNTYGKWADKAQALNAEQAGAQQTMSSGLNIAGQGLSGLASGMNTRTPSVASQSAGAGAGNGGGSELGGLRSSGGGGGDQGYAPLSMSGPQSYQSGYSPTLGDGVGYGWGWSGAVPART